MTKKRPRKLTRSQSKLQDLKPQSPIMVEKDEGEEDLQTQNPNSIEVEALQMQSPRATEEVEGLQSEIPEEERSLVVENHEGSGEDAVQLQNGNPNVNEEVWGTQSSKGNTELIDEDDEEDVMMEVQNPHVELLNRSPGLIEDEKSQLIQNPNEPDQEPNYHKESNSVQPEEQREQEEPEGMSLSHDIHMFDLVPQNPLPCVSNVSRKNPKRKKPLNSRQRAALEKKLQLTKENLQPVPFCPAKTLDFAKHEKLFKRLGLWNFVHLEFDREIRSDLLCLLLANYNPSLRCSFVNDSRIMVNRADLARALKLPVKKDKINPSEGLDSDLLSEESKLFLQDFVSNWILLHEDTWMMPSEVLTWTQFIREGQPQKVDWPGLIWFMVEKELMQVPQLGSCHYASHLQYLMKSQKDDLFKEEPRLEVPMEEGEDPVDLKMRSLEELQGQELEKLQTELCLGQERNESEQEVRDEDVMDFQHCKEEEPGDPAEWLLDSKNQVADPCLRRCNLNKLNDLEDEHVIKEGRDEAEEEEQQVGYDLSSKFPPLERLPSNDLLQAMEHQNISYSPPMQIQNHSSGQFLQSRQPEAHLNPGSSSMFGNACKRELSLEDDAHHHSFNDDHKRMRHDGHWEHKPPDFYLCMEEMNSWMGKARMMYEAKEQACLNAHMNQEILLSEMQQRNSIIASLQKTRFEEVQKHELQIYKLERELVGMSNLLEGYRKALKENRRQFAEYRARFPLPEEPIYKDVGPGGVVLSNLELEKQQLQREEEERKQCLMIEEKIIDFEQGWLGRLEGYLNKVNLLSQRLSEIGIKIELLKEAAAKPKTSEP